MSNNSDDLMSKMMEFGVGIAVAQQMTKAMNSVIGDMAVPTVGMSAPSLPQNVQRQYYVLIDEKVSGPFSEEELKPLIAKGMLTSESLVWRKGMQDWAKADCIPEVNKQIILSR